MSERDTAFHEAGHACARLVLFGEAYSAAIYDDGGPVKGAAGIDGFKKPTPDDFSAEKYDSQVQGIEFKEAFDEAIVREAGHAAVKLLHGCGFLPHLTVSGPDITMVDALARRAFGTEYDQTVLNRFSDLAYTRAICLLGRRWEGVWAVAERLATDRRLTGQQVAEIFGRALSGAKQD